VPRVIRDDNRYDADLKDRPRGWRDARVPELHAELKADLEQRTGLKISDVKVGAINFLNDTAQITIGYYPDEQAGVVEED
jgi:hypothetical protein